jgi:fructose-specific phosphotransferase system IIC component
VLYYLETITVLCNTKKYLLNKKLKIFFNYFVGPVLFVWLSFSMYRQIQNQTDLHQSWSVIKSAFSGPQLGKLVLVIIFMFINWGLEARKWQLLVSSIEKVSFAKDYRVIL